MPEKSLLCNFFYYLAFSKEPKIQKYFQAEIKANIYA